LTNLITNHNKSQSGSTIPVLVVPFFLFTSTFHKLRMFLKKKYVTVSNFVGCCDKKVLVRSCQLLDLLVWTLTNWISFISVWMKIHTVNLDRAMLATVTRVTLSEYSKLLTELSRMQSGSRKSTRSNLCDNFLNTWLLQKCRGKSSPHPSRFLLRHQAVISLGSTGLK